MLFGIPFGVDVTNYFSGKFLELYGLLQYPNKMYIDGLHYERSGWTSSSDSDSCLASLMHRLFLCFAISQHDVPRISLATAIPR